MGILANDSQDWEEFLRELAEPDEPGSFVARNFLLEEGAPVERIASYQSAGCMVRHASKPIWQGRHEVYLRENVYREPPGQEPATVIDPVDADGCPETFRFVDPGSPFLTSETKIHLIRVERILRVRETSGRSGYAQATDHTLL